MAYTCSVKCISEPQYGLAVGYRTDTYALVTYLRVGIILAPLPHNYATISVYVKVLTHSTGKPVEFKGTRVRHVSRMN